MLFSIHCVAKEKLQPHKPVVERAAAYVLTLPGKMLDISVLNTSRKFREFGNKDGAVAAIEFLQECGVGVVHTEKATRGTSKVQNYVYCLQLRQLATKSSLNCAHTQCASWPTVR